MNTTYTTKQGDRWDLIAFTAYGDPKKIKILTDANPRVPLFSILPVGIILNIPILQPVEIAKTNLPPWKR